MILRPYQQEGKDAILKAFEDNDIVMFVLATGGGKTVTFTEIMREYYTKNLRSMLIAHREELITQAWRTIHRSGMISGIIKSGYPNRYEWLNQVGSIQTLARRKFLPFAISVNPFPVKRYGVAVTIKVLALGYFSIKAPYVLSSVTWWPSSIIIKSVCGKNLRRARVCMLPTWFSHSYLFG